MAVISLTRRSRPARCGEPKLSRLAERSRCSASSVSQACWTAGLWLMRGIVPAGAGGASSIQRALAAPEGCAVRFRTAEGQKGRGPCRTAAPAHPLAVQSMARAKQAAAPRSRFPERIEPHLARWFPSRRLTTSERDNSSLDNVRALRHDRVQKYGRQSENGKG